jgi:DNA ligase-3
MSETYDQSGSFGDLVELCQKIEAEGSYIGKTKLVGEFLKNHSVDLYLFCKLLLCKDDKRVYNVKEKQIVKALSRVWHCPLQEIVADLDNGDFSETARKFFEKYGQPQQRSSLTLKQVDDWLQELTKATKAVQQTNHFAMIVSKCTSMDLKILCRIIAHDLKINIGAKFVLGALHPQAWDAYKNSQDLKKVISKIQRHEALLSNEESKSNTGSLTKSLSIGMSVMSPVKPMLARACQSVEEAIQRCPRGLYAEIKYDGERVQIHMQKGEFKCYSRNLKPVLEHKVAQVKDYIPQSTNADTIVLDGEILLVDFKTKKPLPFGTLGIHKKKAFSDACVCYFVFDVLYFNGENLMNKPLVYRKQILEKHVKMIPNRIEHAEYIKATTKEQLQALMNRVLREGLEGLVLKDITSVYEPGARHWLKIKKDYLAGGAMADSADLVVVGAYYGQGAKGGLISTFLMACYDENSAQWKTVCKVGNGLDDNTLRKLQNAFDLVKISQDPTKIPPWLDCHRSYTPDFVVKDPKKSQVWEIVGAQFSKSEHHTANGISIRFPRISRFRDDKDWKTATSLRDLMTIVSASKITDVDAEDMDESDNENRPQAELNNTNRTERLSSDIIPKQTAQSKISSVSCEQQKNTSHNEQKNNNTVGTMTPPQGTLIHYIHRNIVEPFVDNPNNIRMILFCIDDSGKWPKKGIFRAISDVWPEPEQMYTSQAKLEQGDVIFTKVTNHQNKDTKLFFGLLVCQLAKHQKGNTHPFNEKAFQSALKSLIAFAQYKGIKSFHLPKLGYISGLNWNSVENLLNENLAKKGFSVYVYKYTKKEASSAASSLQSPSKNDKDKKRPFSEMGDVDQESIEAEPKMKKAKNDEKESKSKVQSVFGHIFTGKKILFYALESNEKEQTLRNCIITEGGEVKTEEDPLEELTHIVTDENWDKVFDALSRFNANIKVVRSDWVNACVEAGRLLKDDEYLLKK